MEEERWEDYEDIDVSLTGSLGDEDDNAPLGNHTRKRKPSSVSDGDVESLEFKFPTKDSAFIAEEEDFAAVANPPDYTEVSERY